MLQVPRLLWGITLTTTQPVLGGRAYTISLAACDLTNGSITCTAKATPSR